MASHSAYRLEGLIEKNDLLCNDFGQKLSLAQFETLLDQVDGGRCLESLFPSRMNDLWLQSGPIGMEMLKHMLPIS